MKEDSVRTKILQRAMSRSSRPLSAMPTAEESRSATPQEFKPIRQKNRLETTITIQVLKFFKEVYEVLENTHGLTSRLVNKSYAVQDLLEDVPKTHYCLYSDTLSLIQEHSDLNQLEENLSKILAPLQTLEDTQDFVNLQTVLDFRYNAVNAEPYQSICTAYFWLFIRPPAKKPSVARAVSLFLLQPPEAILENVQGLRFVREPEELPFGIREVLLEIPERSPEPVKVISEFLLAAYSCKYEYMPEISLINLSSPSVKSHTHHYSANDVSPLKTLDGKTLHNESLDKNRRVLDDYKGEMKDIQQDVQQVYKGEMKEIQLDVQQFYKGEMKEIQQDIQQVYKGEMKEIQQDAQPVRTKIIHKKIRHDSVDSYRDNVFTNTNLNYSTHSHSKLNTSQPSSKKEDRRFHAKKEYSNPKFNKKHSKVVHKIVSSKVPSSGDLSDYNSKASFDAMESFSELNSKCKFPSFEMNKDFSEIHSKKEDFSDLGSRKGDFLDCHSKLSSDNMTRNEDSSLFFNKEFPELCSKEPSFGDEPAPKVVETSLLSIIGVNKPRISTLFKDFIIRKLNENPRISLFPNKDKLIKEFSSELNRNDLKLLESLKSDQKYRRIISEARKETGLAKSSPFEWRHSLIAKRRASAHRK